MPKKNSDRPRATFSLPAHIEKFLLSVKRRNKLHTLQAAFEQAMRDAGAK